MIGCSLAPVDKPRKVDHGQFGYSLLEMLVCLVLVVCMGCSFLPFNALMQERQKKLLAQEITEALRFARMEAQMTGKVLQLTPLRGEENWARGLLLVEKTHDGHEGTLHHQWHWSYPNLVMIWHGFLSNHYVQFEPNLADNASNGYFLINDTSLKSLTLVVTRLGVVR